MVNDVRRRLVRRGGVVVTALLGSLLVVPAGVAHADVSATALPISAFRAGVAAQPPVARAALALPGGDLVQGGELTAPTTFGSVLLDPSSGSPGFLARLSRDGSTVRWAHDLGGPGHLDGLVRRQGSVVSLRSTFDGGAGNARAAVTAWDATTGQSLWDNPLPNAQMLVRPDLAVAPDGTLLVAGTYSGKLSLRGGSFLPAAPSGSGFVIALDPSNGAPLWGRSFSADSFVLQSIAVSPGGVVYAGGLFTGTFVENGTQKAAAQPYGEGVLISLGPDGATRWWRSYASQGTYPQLDNLVATDSQVFARTMAAVVPGQGGPAVAALSAADGAGQWAKSMTSTSFWSQTAPLALLADGTVVAGLTFPGSTVIGGRALSTADGTTDVAVLGLAPESGAVRYLDQLGAAGDDALVDVTADGSDLLLSGSLTVTNSAGGVVDHATLVRVGSPRSLTIVVTGSAPVRSDVPFSVVSEPSEPSTTTVSGPCHLVSGAGSLVHLDHVGDCQITARTSLVQVTAHLQAMPLVPQLAGPWPAAGLTWPTATPADLGARFVDDQGAPVPGTVTYSLAPGSVLDPGTYPVTATFTSSDPDVAGATAASTLLVGKARPTVTFTAPATLVYGTPFTASVTATGVDGAALPGTYSLAPAAGTVLDVGEYRVGATFTANDTAHYDQAFASGTLTVTKAVSRVDARWWKLQQRLTATLADVSNNRPLGGQAVVFTWSGGSCTAVTDYLGNAECALTALQTANALLSGVDVVYAGDRNHAGTATALGPTR